MASKHVFPDPKLMRFHLPFFLKPVGLATSHRSRGGPPPWSSQPQSSGLTDDDAQAFACLRGPTGDSGKPHKHPVACQTRSTLWSGRSSALRGGARPLPQVTSPGRLALSAASMLESLLLLLRSRREARTCERSPLTT